MAYPKIIGSVDNPEQLSRTLESGGRLILAVAALFGVSEAPMNEALQMTGQFIFGLYGLYHMGRTLYGVWRKVYTLFREKV